MKKSKKCNFNSQTKENIKKEICDVTLPKIKSDVIAINSVEGPFNISVQKVDEFK